LLPALPAHAQDAAAAAFQQFGLEGVWSPDCSLPPSHDNPRVHWVIPPSGPVQHRVTFDGEKFDIADTVSDATILADNQIQFSAAQDGQVFLTVIVERVGNRIHAMQSIGVDGTRYYVDGIQVATGKPSLSAERCDIGPPGS
jgi:hypothetical protein